jgi:hypothetical protein
MGGVMKSWAIYVIAALGFVIYGAVTDVDRDSTGAIVGSGNIDPFKMRVGDCFNDVSSYDEEINNLPGVPCSEPHDNEAFAVFDLAVASYPGDDEMEALAYDSCMQRFDSFAGTDYDSSTLEIFPIYPTDTSWKQNDREVVCSVYDMDANKLVGSAEARGL